MDVTHEITEDLPGTAFEVDASEQLTSPAPGRILEKGTQFYICRPKHDWSPDPNDEQKVPYYTIWIRAEDKHYNIQASLIESRKRRIAPPES